MKKFNFSLTSFSATIGLAATLAAPMPAMASQTSVKTVIGNVSNVEVLTQTYVRKTPVEQKVCTTEDVPIYEEAQGGDELGGLIIGGLLGAAVGNSVSGADGAGTAGAVAGALIGRDQAKKQKTTGKIVGYRQQDVCEIQKSVREERVEEVTGYRLSITVGGDTVKLKTKRSYDVGDEIEIRQQTTYSLN